MLPSRSSRRALRALLPLAALTLATTACADDAAAPLAPTTPVAAKGGGKPGTPIARGPIVFSMELGGNSELYTVREDGTGLTRLTYNPGVDITPEYSPDGRKLVWLSERDGVAELYTMNADGTQPRRLTTLGLPMGLLLNPTWSPDGRTIAFQMASADNSGWDVYAMPARGGTPVRLTDAYGDDIHPEYTPDGQYLVYASQNGDMSGPRLLRIMRPDGSENAIYLSAATSLAVPAFSPDGRYLAYNAGGEIRVRNLSTGFETVVAADGDAAVWSPDGVMLAVTTFQPEYRLGVVTMGGGPVRYVSPVGGLPNGDADWRR